MGIPKDESLSEYEGFDFQSPLFAYLGDYGVKEVMRCGKRQIEKIELDLNPDEIEKSGWREQEKLSDPDFSEDCP